MQLTLEEAARRLGKSTRQVRYLIQQERLKARKFAGRWVIDSEDLPLSPGQRQAVERRERELRTAVDEALGLPAGDDRKPRYSIRDLKAFQIAAPLYHRAETQLGAEHPATAALRQVLGELTRGCHRFDRSEKAAAYRQARDAASLAVCELVLAGGAEADHLVQAIEQELMAAFAGLLRRLERRR